MLHARRSPVVLLAVLASFAAGSARAQFSGGTSELIGGAGAALSSPAAAEVNPANAAFIERTSIESNGTLYHSDTLMIRYPGFATVNQSDSGLGLPLGLPSFIYKLNARFGVGGFFVPGVGLGKDVEVKRIPVLIFNTLNYIDFKGKGTLDGYAHLVAGFRITKQIGVGINFTNLGASFDLHGTPSSGGAELIEIKGKLSQTTANLGLRFDVVPGRFAVGGSFAFLSKTELKPEIKLLGGIAAGAAGGGEGAAPAGGGGGSESSLVNPFGQFTAGAQIGLSSKFRILGDIRYTKADKTAKQFSIVELKEKTLDAHSTLAVSAGAIINMTDTANAMIGYHNQPAAIGQGGRGDGSLAGFGTIDLAKIMAGLDGLDPYVQYSAGGQFGFLPKTERHGKEVTGYYALTVSTGLIYKKASRGSDAASEQPGAYYQKSTSIPLGLIYRF